MNQMVFITTEDCNMRCKYCVYSGSYNNMRLHNSNHKLSLEVAQKAIDYFLRYSTNEFNKIIVFYGGEALTEFSLIRKIVEYAKSLNVKVRFAMNTNLTLLTPTILKFLVQNEFLLTVSLDGPKEIHDLYRVTKNQLPTYDIVVRNLQMIKDYDEEYYNSHLRINTVLVPHTLEISALDEFFSRDLFITLPMESLNVLTLNPEENEFVSKYNYDVFFRNYYNYSYNKFVDAHIKGKTDFCDMRISYNSFIRGMKKIYYRDMNRLNEYSFYWPNGICIPGIRSLLVTPDGDYYPCENLYDLKEFKMGNVNEGFNINRIVNMIDEYISYANKLCKDCWAYRFCSHCYYSAFQNDHYNITYKRKNCELLKEDIKNEFIMFLKIVSHNPHAFDYLDNKDRDVIYSHMIND